MKDGQCGQLSGGKNTLIHILITKNVTVDLKGGDSKKDKKYCSVRDHYQFNQRSQLSEQEPVNQLINKSTKKPEN